MLLIFDVNETLLDVSALDELVGRVLGGDGPAARRAWFDRMIRSALTLTAAEAYEPFGALAGAALRDLAAERGRSASEDDVRRLAAQIQSLPAHPDVAPALARLREAGHRIVTLTNSVLEVAHAQVDNSGLREYVDAVYSADEVRRLKPAPVPYRMVLDRERVAHAAVLVAAHDWDVAGAAAAGLETAFLAREGRVPFGIAATPTYLARDLGDLVAALATP
jgi:2-haloacid dehalogenase